MSFTTSKITDLTLITRLLTDAQLEKDNLENELTNLVYRRNQMDLEEQGTLVQIQGHQSELDAVNAALPTMAEGENKEEFEDRATRLNFALFQAKNRLKRYGGAAMVANERAQNKATALVTDVTAYITALQTRKTELEA